MTEYKIYSADEVRAMTKEEKKAAKVSKYFSVWEVECHCGCGLANVNPKQLQAMDDFRELLGRPIHTRWGVNDNSGSVCRCVQHNKEIGGEVNSKHTTFQAMDCMVKRMSPLQVFIMAAQIPAFKQGGRGVYDTFTHLDTGTGNKRPAVWDRRTK